MQRHACVEALDSKTHVHMNTHKNTHTQTHARTCPYTHTHTHTHTHPVEGNGYFFPSYRQFYLSRESKWGTLKSAGNPRCAVPAEIHSICTDRRDLGPGACLQVSPTSDTCQSVAILMNRRHCRFPRPCLVPAIIFPHTKWLPKITNYRDTAALTLGRPSPPSRVGSVSRSHCKSLEARRPSIAGTSRSNGLVKGGDA